MKLLAVNLLLDKGLVHDFDQAVKRLVENCAPGSEVKIRHISELYDAELQSGTYTHLILSGSEASVVEQNPWDDDLQRLIVSSVESGTSVLGICYGEQFLARTLAGREHVRQRAEKVWGWLRMSLADNPLFHGLSESVCLTVNSDEVFDLPAPFKVIASLDHCGVMAFQYGNKPIWGVQFHPEYNIAEGNRVIQTVESLCDPNSHSLINEMDATDSTRLNQDIFSNFFSSKNRALIPLIPAS